MIAGEAVANQTPIEAHPAEAAVAASEAAVKAGGGHPSAGSNEAADDEAAHAGLVRQLVRARQPPRVEAGEYKVQTEGSGQPDCGEGWRGQQGRGAGRHEVE
jgi:hypothetical protein